MFTIKDICNIAVQIEQNGEATYRKAAQNVSDEKVREVLNWMADQEKLHAEWFDGIVIEQEKEVDCREVEAMGRALLQEMVKDQTFSLNASAMANAGTKDALIEQSIAFERDTIAFYRVLSGFLEDEKVQAQLDQIIQEEKNHIIQLEDLRGKSIMA